MTYPIRVLFLFTHMNRGGAESMVMNYYRHIDRTKLQFDFMVHRQERGAYDDEIESLGGKIYRMMPFYPLTFPQYKKQISEFFDKHSEYKIIHGHCSELGYFVYREAAKRGVPHIIAHAHNSHAQFDLKWPFRTYFKHRMRKYLTEHFTCGQESSVWLFGPKLAKKAILQRNAIETDKYLFNPDSRKRIREEFHIPSDALVIGHVGRFERQKNHEFLINVFQEIAALRSDAYLLLVGGGGNLESEIKQKVKEKGLDNKVIFTGVRPDVPDLLQAMDVFLFPSFMEGLSLSMLEAQSAGLPCIASDTIPREVEMTDLITFYPLKKNPQEWAKQVLSAASKTIDRSIYPQKIKDAGYDICQNAQWLQNYYLSLLN